MPSAALKQPRGFQTSFHPPAQTEGQGSFYLQYIMKALPISPPRKLINPLLLIFLFPPLCSLSVVQVLLGGGDG